jgi:hypothetical protein
VTAAADTQKDVDRPIRCSSLILEHEEHLKTMHLAMTETYSATVWLQIVKIIHLAMTGTYSAAVWLQMVKIMHLEMAHHGTPEGKVELN